MAKHVSSSVLVLVLALIATSGADAQGILGHFNGIPISAVSVAGIVTCTLPGTLPTGPPIVGVNVTISCDGGLTTLGQGVTNSLGIFQIVVRILNTPLLTNPTTCKAFIKLPPLLDCTVFPPNTTLQSPLSVGGVVSGLLSGLGGLLGGVLALLGFVLQLVAPVFSLVS